MYRITKIRSKYYAYEIHDIISDEENIERFIEEGPVIIVRDLEDLKELDIYEDQIELVTSEK